MTTTTQKNEILTTTLNDRRSVVLAKMTKFGLSAVKYTNVTQAMKKAEELRGRFMAVEVFQPQCGPVFFIRMIG